MARHLVAGLGNPWLSSRRLELLPKEVEAHETQMQLGWTFLIVLLGPR